MKKKKKNRKPHLQAATVSACYFFARKKQALFKLRYIKDAMLRKRERKKSKLKGRREVKRKKETDKQTDRQTDRQTDEKEINLRDTCRLDIFSPWLKCHRHHNFAKLRTITRVNRNKYARTFKGLFTWRWRTPGKGSRYPIYLTSEKPGLHMQPRGAWVRFKMLSRGLLVRISTKNSEIIAQMNITLPHL